MRINEKIKLELTRKNMTQVELASKLKLDPARLSNFMNRKNYRKYEILEKMMQILNIELK